MNSGRKDGKRKFQNWSDRHSRGLKRFRGTDRSKGNRNNARDDATRNGESRWDKTYRPMDDSFVYDMSKFNWSSQNRNSGNSFRHPHQNPSFQQMFDYRSEATTDIRREHEEAVGPGSESERMEKVRATKRRIEEALAMKSSDGGNQEINFQNSLKESNKDKTNGKSLPANTVELRLTNSDFKEIGSVASGVAAEGETDIILNVAPCSSTQRSFDSTCQPPTVPSSKSPRIGGWTMSDINEIAPQLVHSNLGRIGGERYLQESRERVLGSILPCSVGGHDGPESSLQKPSNSSPKHNVRNDFSRVGQLYQSFLKSRLCGYTLKMRDKTPKPIGPKLNPLLDKSVLENQHTKTNSIQTDTILELECPRPIQVKMDVLAKDYAEKNIAEDIAAKEANEFCKEFSFLLTDKNFLIPPEDLEKLGLSHLNEMNKLVSEKRNIPHETESLLENRDGLLRVRSLNALNNLSENDITLNKSPEHSSYSFPDSSLVNISGNGNNLNISGTSESNKPHPHGGPHQSANSFQTPSGGQPLSFRTLEPQASPTSAGPAPQIQMSVGENTIETVVEKVLEKLLNKSSSINAQVLNSNIQDMINSRISQSNFKPTPNGPESSDSSGSISNNPPSSPQLQIISSKILRLFLIDKQMEELIQEKMKIYAELLSAKEISSTLFNSWAQDQIQQGNVMNVVTNSSNTVPELARMMVNEGTNQANPSVAGLFNGNRFQTDLMDVKNELIEQQRQRMFQNMKVESCMPSDLEPPDSVFQTPNTSAEIIRPKLSVRKDLHDPNLNRTLLRCDPSSVEKPIEEESPVSSKKNGLNFIPTQINIKEEFSAGLSQNRVKKKSKKKDSQMEVVNLLDDTTDEELCSISAEGSVTGRDPLATDESTLLADNSLLSKKKKKKNLIFNLVNNTATCMTTLKNALFVGCKDGCLNVFSLLTGDQDLAVQLHSEAIVCIKTYIKSSHKFVITGSTDSTLSLFSLQDEVIMQTVEVKNPIQCFDFDNAKAYVGTKSGGLLNYRLKVITEETGELSGVSLDQVQPPLQLTSSSILALKAAKEGARRVLIVASRGEQITVRDAGTGLVLRTFDWCDTVFCLQLYGDSSLVFCGTKIKSVKAVNFVTGENMRDCTVGRAINQIQFVQSVMFAACSDGKVYIYDVEENCLITCVSMAKGPILCMTVHKQKIVVANLLEVRAIAFPPELKTHLKDRNATET